METVILVVHLLIAIALIATVLLQRSEGGALGIGGSGGSFMSARGTANVLTRSTAVLAGAFFLTSIVLTILAKGKVEQPSILDTAPDSAIEQPLAPLAPAEPAEPAVPLGDDAP